MTAKDLSLREYPEDIDFKKYWLILKRRWFAAGTIFLLVVTAALAYAFLKKPTFEAEGKLLLKKRNTTSSLVTSASEKIGQLESLNVLNSPLDTEAEVIRSATLIQKAIDDLQLRDTNGLPLKQLDFLKQLTVTGVKGTDVLLISFKSKDPQEAARVVNKLIDLYIESNIQSNRAEAVAAREFITKQLPETEATVRQAEVALRNFRERYSIIVLEEEASAAIRAIAELDSQMAQVQAQLEQVTARSTALQGKLGLTSNQAMALNSLSQSAGVQQVLQELRNIEAQLTADRTRFTDTHPIILNLNNKKAGLEALLEQRVQETLGRQMPLPTQNYQLGHSREKLIDSLIEAEVERLALSNQIASLARTKSVYKQRGNIVPKLQQQQRDLQRQVEAAQSAYTILLRNLQEVRIAENQNVGNARVVSYALIPERPVGTRKLIILGAGFVVATLLYIITACAIDLTDPSIKTAKDLRGVFRYTLLGMIPSWKKRSLGPRKSNDLARPVPVRDMPDALVSESFRMLQANLKFVSPDLELKTIVVTSCVSKEGKSTVSANLAAAMAQLGHRVLLIDADMRHPVQHHIWDLTNAVGLSDVIMNRVDFQMAVREVMDNLDVLPSGVIPPNPLTLLDSQRMKSLIEDFSKKYHFVIIDTPPLVVVADAITLGKITNGILLVSQPGVVDAASAATAKELLVQSGQNVLGLAINGVAIQNEPDSYFHHAKAYYKDFTAVGS